jgi:hypothetical protein
MLLATVYATKFAQNCPKLPNFAKICPKIISLRNFEILAKIEILIFFKKVTSKHRGGTKACAHHLDIQYK